MALGILGQRGFPLIVLSRLVERGLHRGVATSEPLDGEVVGLVVGKAKVVFGADEGFLDLLEMGNGLVDLVDGGLELLAGKAIVAAEGLLEGSQLALEVGHNDALAAGNGELPLVFHSLLGRIHQEGDDSLEELGTDDVHLRVAMGDIHDAAIVQVAIHLQEGDQNGILASLSVAVGVELLEEVLVAVFGGCLVHLVLHFKHDGHVLHVIFVVAEDEVALAAAGGVIILLEVCFRE